MSGVNSTAVRRLVDLRREKDEHAKRIKEIDNELSSIEETLMEAFAAEGLQSMKIGGATVYLHRTVWAKKVNSEVTGSDICQALVDAGQGDLVSESFNWQTLSAYVRECDVDGTPLPEPLAAVIEPTEKFALRVRGL